MSCPNPSDQVEIIDHHFHRMTFSPSGGNGADPNGAAAFYNYDRDVDAWMTAETAVWDFQADLTRWTATNLIDLTQYPNEEIPSHGALTGPLWVHANTFVGAYFPGGDQGVHAPFLANHHTHAFQPEEVHTSDGISLVFVPEYFFLWQTLPDPWTPPFRRWDAQLLETSMVAVADGEWGALDRDGNLELITNRVGVALQDSVLDTTTIWVNAAEPHVYAGSDTSLPRAVGLSAGGVIRELVFMDGQSLQGAGDVAAEILDVVGAPAGEGCSFVYARARNTVFALGGLDPELTPTREIAFMRLDDAVWQTLPSTFKPQVVLAATYNYFTNELFVLDTKKGFARLHAVNVIEGTARLIGSWERLAEWDDQWLVTDRDGTLLLASSGNVLGGPSIYRIAKIDVNPELEAPSLLGIVSGYSTLAMPPVADPAGYTLVHGGAAITVTRTEALSFAPADWEDLGAQL